MAAYTERVE